MIKYLIYFLFIPLLSCVELITNIDYYESIYFQGSGWIEFYGENLEDQLIFDSDFSLQLWFSGNSVADEDAPCILSIQDQELDLAIYRDLNISNELTIYINQVLWEIEEIDGMNLNIDENFYLLSLVVQESSITIYINDTLILTAEDINIISPEIIIGGYINKTEDEYGNYWYGYVDEIRLWDIALAQEDIIFHTEYTDKITTSYEDENLESLISLWDFQIEMNIETIPYIFQDIYDNPVHAIIYTLESKETKLSELGR